MAILVHFQPLSLDGPPEGQKTSRVVQRPCMPSPISLLYEPLIARDVKAVPAAVRKFRKSHAQEELFQAVARFALLSYSPSQHGKHAVLSCLAAHDLRDELRARFDETLTECAIYAAQSRQPWSEPPITDPPALADEQSGAIEEIEEAIEQSDRLRAERWLARRIADADFAGDYFRVAARDLSDYGHKLIVATAAWRLAELLGEKGRFATLRVAVTEWTAHKGESCSGGKPSREAAELLPHLIERMVLDGGSTLSFHPIALLDATLSASQLGADQMVVPQALHAIEQDLARLIDQRPMVMDAHVKPFAPYRLARDYGQCLKAYAIFNRLQPLFPDVDCAPIVTSSRHNLRHGPSFEEWSFA